LLGATYPECHLKSRYDRHVGIALHPPTHPTDPHVHLDTVEHRTVSDRYEKEDSGSWRSRKKKTEEEDEGDGNEDDDDDDNADDGYSV